jgi:hypothetical protein
VVVRCPQETCTVSATAAVTLPGRRTLRLTSPRRRVAAEQAAGLRLALAREARTRVRRALRSGRRLHALVRVLASDEAGNQTLVTRTIRLTG